MTATVIDINRHRPASEQRASADRLRALGATAPSLHPGARAAYLASTEIDAVALGDVHHLELETLCVGESR